MDNENYNLRNDKEMLGNISITKKILLGVSMYVPSSALKKAIFRTLGAKVGKNVYFGPGSLLMSNSFRDVSIGNNVFVAPLLSMSIRS
jgi:hypothetical protein